MNEKLSIGYIKYKCNRFIRRFIKNIPERFYFTDGQLEYEYPMKNSKYHGQQKLY